MPGVVVDTHALLWYLLGSDRLSTTARREIDRALAAGDAVRIASVTLVELTYPVEKGRLPVVAQTRLSAMLDAPDSGLVLAPLDRQVADSVERVARDQVPDMPDRIIAATALHLGLPLVTRDGRIRATNVQTVW
jgi:PIN domain nuclease of toxin-antitoxin system